MGWGVRLGRGCVHVRVFGCGAGRCLQSFFQRLGLRFLEIQFESALFDGCLMVFGECDEFSLLLLDPDLQLADDVFDLLDFSIPFWLAF